MPRCQRRKIPVSVVVSVFMRYEGLLGVVTADTKSTDERRFAQFLCGLRIIP
jgi:hypothetical protein